MGVNFEIRDNKLHISGYVNAVERDSLPIMTKRGKCVEQIKAGAFAESIADGHEIRLRYNHKRDIGSTADGALTLKEDNIGLYAEAETADEEIMALAAKGELRGWSFGFTAKDDTMEERANNIPRRHVNALELSEVSILSVQPAYNGTSLEYRAYSSYEDISSNVTIHKADGEIMGITETERQHTEGADGYSDTMTRTDTSQEGTRTETTTSETSWKKDNEALNAKIQRLIMQGRIMKMRAEQNALEQAEKRAWMERQLEEIYRRGEILERRERELRRYGRL